MSAHPPDAAGVEMSLRIGQRVRHRDYKGKRVTGVVYALAVEDRALMVTIRLDQPIVIEAGDQRPLDIWTQHVPATELTPFDDRDELVAAMLQALQTTRGNIASLGPAGAIPFEYREWLATVDVAIAKAITTGCAA